MTLRAKFVLYLIAIHLPPAILAGFLFQGERRIWLVAIEVGLAVSLVVGSHLVRSLFEPLDLLRGGEKLLDEQELTTRFKHVGHPDVDRLFDVYNVMVERLREERVRTEEQQSLLEKILQLTPAGIVMLGFDGNIAQVNPAVRRLLGYEGDSGGEPLSSLGETFQEHASRLRAGESALIGSDGRRRLRLWRGDFMDRGFPRTFYVVEELTEELRASERAAYEKVIRMLSHEINNSVAAVSSLLESLLHYAGSLGEEDRGDYTSAIEISRTRLRNLDSFTRDFASVVRIPEPVTADVDLTQLVTDVFRLLGPELASRSISARVDGDGGSVVRVDQNQIEQVIINVVRNAMESIGRDGQIVASLGNDDSLVTLAIRDDGAGLSEEARAHLFTPFYSSKRNGRGLGLTLIQEILSNHGAEFSLRNVEGGAEFRAAFRHAAQPGG